MNWQRFPARSIRQSTAQFRTEGLEAENLLQTLWIFQMSQTVSDTEALSHCLLGIQSPSELNIDSGEHPDISIFINNNLFFHEFSSVQSCLNSQSCLTLCDPMNRNTPGLPVHHQLLESTQTHVH